MVNIIRKPIPSGNWASDEYARGVRHKKVGAILHIMVGWLPGTTAHFQNPDTGYATSLGVGTVDARDGSPVEVHRYVPADGRAYGSANSYADGRGESIEMAGIYTVTREVLDGVAELLVHLHIEEDWPPIGGKRQFVLGDFPDHRYAGESIPDFGVKYNLITHRSMAYKNCPNDTDLAYLVRKANQLLAASGGSNPAGASEEEDDDMSKNSAFIYTRSDKREIVLLVNTSSGWWMEYVSSNSIVPEGNNPIAATLDTGSYARVSEVFAKALKASIPRAQGVVVSGELTIAEDAG